MHGEDVFQESLFTTVQLESFVPSDHPLRAIKALLDEAMKDLDQLFGSIDSNTGRESIPPERLIRAQLNLTRIRALQGQSAYRETMP